MVPLSTRKEFKQWWNPSTARTQLGQSSNGVTEIVTDSGDDWNECLLSRNEIQEERFDFIASLPLLIFFLSFAFKYKNSDIASFCTLSNSCQNEAQAPTAWLWRWDSCGSSASATITVACSALERQHRSKDTARRKLYIELISRHQSSGNSLGWKWIYRLQPWRILLQNPTLWTWTATNPWRQAEIRNNYPEAWTLQPNTTLAIWYWPAARKVQFL